MESTTRDRGLEANAIKTCLKERGVQFKGIVVTKKEVRVLGCSSSLPRTRYFIMRTLGAKFIKALKVDDGTYSVSFERLESLE